MLTKISRYEFVNMMKLLFFQSYKIITLSWTVLSVKTEFKWFVLNFVITHNWNFSHFSKIYNFFLYLQFVYFYPIMPFPFCPRKSQMDFWTTAIGFCQITRKTWSAPLTWIHIFVAHTLFTISLMKYLLKGYLFYTVIIQNPVLLTIFQDKWML